MERPGQDAEEEAPPSRAPRPTKETYAGNMTAEEIQKSAAGAPPARPRPARQTFPGTEKPEIEAETAEKPTGDVPAGTPLACLACRNVMKLALAAPVGRKIKCPGCSQPVTVRWPDEETAAIEHEATARRAEAAAAAAASAPALERPLLDQVAKPKTAEVAPAAKKLSLPVLIGGGVAAAGLVLLLIVFFVLGEKEIPESAWAPFKPPGGLCEVQMPGKPTLQGSKGAATGTTQYFVRRNEMNSMFILSYINLPPGGLKPAAFEEIYQSERGQLLEASKGTVRSEQDLVWNGHPGKEVVIAAADGRLISQRQFVVEADSLTRLFILEASGRWRNADKGSAARFMESFKLPPRGKVVTPEHE